jgi:hypothetical protein
MKAHAAGAPSKKNPRAARFFSDPLQNALRYAGRFAEQFGREVALLLLRKRCVVRLRALQKDEISDALARA